MSSPWGKIVVPEAVNLDDIMSEEVARDLQEKENRKYAEFVEKKETTDDVANTVDLCAKFKTDSDEAIALELQKQFDKEYDEMLKRSEEKYNGTSKVSVSFSNYRRAPVALGKYTRFIFLLFNKVTNRVLQIFRATRRKKN